MTAALLLALASPHDDIPAGRLSSSERAQPPLPADTDVAARIRAGDAGAFDQLVEAWWTPLWRFARTQVGSDAAAEDVVQDIFAWIWSRRDAWEPAHSIRAYLYRMVRNRITGERRHTRVSNAHAARERATPERFVTSESDALVDAELVGRLNVALDRLPAARREAVLLRYIHGLTHTEVAAVIGVSPAAAEKQVARALDSLRAWMRDA
jgi:RNA polymerase sigma-70 factor (ECF subfamily)